MKHLYLVRHANALWKDNTNIVDIDRPLSKRGIREAHQMADFIFAHEQIPDFMITSPAVRAASTAAIFARALRYRHQDIIYADELYDATVDNIVTVITRLPDRADHVMLFGHNPSLLEFSRQYGNQLPNEFLTSAVVKFTLELSHWQAFASAKIILEKYYRPKDL